jgi:excisionase family DNA binding protein
LTEYFPSVNLGVMNLLSTNQAAEQLGISARRVRMLIEAGSLTAQQIGREWVIEAHALAGVKVYGKAGRPPKPTVDTTHAPAQASAKNSTSGRSAGRTSKLNKAFRKATELEGKKGGKKQ